jgi:transcriptional regulator with PAS, ATPase and Fis domain
LTTSQDAHNWVISVVGAAQVVTEAVTHDRDVATMTQYLRQVITNAPILGMDVHGNMNKWNNKTAKITGFPKKEAFNEPLMAMLIVQQLWHCKGNATSNYELE